MKVTIHGGAARLLFRLENDKNKNNKSCLTWKLPIDLVGCCCCCNDSRDKTNKNLPTALRPSVTRSLTKSPALIWLFHRYIPFSLLLLPSFLFFYFNLHFEKMSQLFQLLIINKNLKFIDGREMATKKTSRQCTATDDDEGGGGFCASVMGHAPYLVDLQKTKQNQTKRYKFTQWSVGFPSLT